MNVKELIEGLVDAGVVPVIIGGVAMRIYESTRATRSVELVIRSLDLDEAVAFMYRHGRVLVRDVGESSVTVLGSTDVADAWIDSALPGSLTFVALPDGRSTGDFTARIPHSEIEITTQVDLLYELAVPYVRLRERARSISLAGVEAIVAAPADLLAIKRAARERTADDEADIAFLERLLKTEGARRL